MKLNNIGCCACQSTGLRQVKGGRSAIFQYKKKCEAAKSQNKPLPKQPKRIVNCHDCNGLGIVSGSNTTFKPAFSGKIAVIGGGIGGIAFSLAALHRGLNVTVYEKDIAFAIRSQGYALTMQQGFTQLRKLGFDMDKLREIGSTSTGHITLSHLGDIVGVTGRERWGTLDDASAKRFNIQLPRQLLRQELFNELPQDTVQWGKQLVQIDDSEQILHFSDGTTADYDLVVAADGIRSCFTSHLPLSYLGVMVVLGRGKVSTPNKLNLGVDKIWQSVDGVTRLYAMPFGKAGETMWQLSWQCSEQEAINLSRGQKVAGEDRIVDKKVLGELLLSEALRRTEGWHDPLHELLTSTDPGEITGYPAYDRWPVPMYGPDNLRPRVAVLGDAAHPLSPFKGQGANQALIDAVELATILASGITEEGTERPHSIASGRRNRQRSLSCSSDNSIGSEVDVEALLQTYHVRMTERVRIKVEASREASIVLHSPSVLVKGDCTRGKARCSDVAKYDSV